MQHTPCEYMLWNGIPTIRKELAELMTKKFGLSQRETAEKLGISPAAVCQYLSKKRGRINILDESIMKQLTISAEKIIQNGNSHVIIETCKICRLVQKSKEFTDLNDETVHKKE